MGAVSDRRPFELDLDTWSRLELALAFTFDFGNIHFGDKSVMPDGDPGSVDSIPNWLAGNRREVLAEEVSAAWGVASDILREYPETWPDSESMGSGPEYPDWVELKSSPAPNFELCVPKGERKGEMRPRQV